MLLFEGGKNIYKKIMFVVIAVLLICVVLSGCIEREVSGRAYGIFYINDSGELKGGWEYTQAYYANLTINNGIGKLKINVIPDAMGNKLTKHNFSVVLKNYTDDKMILLIGGKKVILEWIEHDDVWNKWHNHYIASYGKYMDDDETIGKIRPNVFPGVGNHYYVELRLPKIN